VGARRKLKFPIPYHLIPITYYRCAKLKMMKIAQIDFGSLEAVAAPAFAGGTLGNIVNSAILYLFPIAGFLLLIYLIYGGYQYLLSGGDPKSIDAGKKNITYAVIGFIIIFLAYWIVQIVGRILGIGAIGDIFSP
jgi:hypothetical protein